MPAPSHRWVWPLLLTLTGSVVFANSLSGVFTFDDIVGLVENESIRQLWPPTAVLSPPADSEPVAGRPLVNVSFAINYALDGLEVRGYHAVNIALHIGCALLLFGLVRRTLLLPGSGTPWLTPPFRAEYVAAAAALLWMVHPLTTEAVNYVSQRTELMMALFLLATLYAGVRAAVDRGRWPLVAVATCALGMACKETMVVAPVLVVLYDRVFLYRSWAEAARARGSFYPALAATWILLAALIWSGPRWETAGFSTGVSPWTYLLNQSVILVEYLKRVIWPVNLVHDYGEPLARSLSGVAPYAATIVALLAATAYALMRHPAVGFLGATFFLVLAPTSSILPIATEVGAERRMYLPLAALSVLLVLAATDVWRRIPRLALPGALATMLLLAVPLSAATIVRNRDYADELTLWQTTLERWPHARAHRNYATLLKREGRREQVIEHLRLALDGTHPEGRYALGVELLEQGRTAEAIGELRRFLEELPHDPMADLCQGMVESGPGAHTGRRRHASHRGLPAGSSARPTGPGDAPEPCCRADRDGPGR
jgi:tetratricopeptide (TPR) repeat protein